MLLDLIKMIRFGEVYDKIMRIDGSKRTSRILGNAVLLAEEAFPLSFRSVNEVRYKEGTLLFYEQNKISLFKEIYLEQAQFAVENYFKA